MYRKRFSEVNVGFAEGLKGGVIIEVTEVTQAKIAEKTGAIAVLISTADCEAAGPFAITRMPDIAIIREIQQSISIPVIAKCRVGHFVEAQILEVLNVDFIDECDLLTPADAEHHINKHKFRVPFVGGAKDLGEALIRIAEGAALIRTQGDLTGRGNIVESVRQMRSIQQEIRRLAHMNEDELMTRAKQIGAPYHLVLQAAELQRLPVPLFAAGGIHTPLDVALMMQLGAEGVFVEGSIFTSPHPNLTVSTLVQSVNHCREPEKLAQLLLDTVKSHSQPYDSVDKLTPFPTNLNMLQSMHTLIED